MKLPVPTRADVEGLSDADADSVIDAAFIETARHGAAVIAVTWVAALMDFGLPETVVAKLLDEVLDATTEDREDKVLMIALIGKLAESIEGESEDL